MYGWEMKPIQLKHLIKFTPYNSFLNILESTQEDLRINTQDLKEILNNGTSSMETVLGKTQTMHHVRITIIVISSLQMINVFCCFQNVTTKEHRAIFVMILLSLMLTMKSNQSQFQKVRQSTFTTCHVSREKLHKSQIALIAQEKQVKTKLDSRTSLTQE